MQATDPLLNFLQDLKFSDYICVISSKQLRVVVSTQRFKGWSPIMMCLWLTLINVPLQTLCQNANDVNGQVSFLSLKISSVPTFHFCFEEFHVSDTRFQSQNNLLGHSRLIIQESR